MIDNPSFGGYTPLDEGEIRLLRVQDPSSLTCEFLKVRIDTAGPYFALSYTWGERGTYSSITVNGLEFKVRRNLYHFCSTWLPKMEIGSLIWIDAICINQGDDLERDAQILIVDSIYSHAKCVPCWLGTATENTGAAFDRIRQIADQFAPVIQNKDPNVSAWNVIQDQDATLLRWLPNDSQSTKIWQGIAEILQCQYFSRTWIVQETVHNSNNKVLFFGTFSIDWNALGLLDYILYLKAVSYQLDLPWDYTTMRPGILFNLRERLKNRNSIDLLSLLYSTISFGCKNARDKIFAIRSLARDVGKRDLLPECRKSLPDVYRDVVEFHLRRHGDDGRGLEFLAYASNASGRVTEDEDNSTMPSWVPDWRYNMATYPFPTNHVYRPSLDQEAVVQIDGSHLHVEGLELDVISNMSPFCSSQMVKDIKLDPEWENLWDQYCNEQAPEHMSISLKSVVVADVLRGDKITRGHQIDWEFARRAREQPKERYPESCSSSQSFIHACYGRRLVVTSQGHIGIAPGTSQLKDKVCILFGGQTLYVLRELKQDRHRFIGHCYVHGLMDGEGMSPSERLPRSSKKFCIV